MLKVKFNSETLFGITGAMYSIHEYSLVSVLDKLVNYFLPFFIFIVLFNHPKILFMKENMWTLNSFLHLLVLYSKFSKLKNQLFLFCFAIHFSCVVLGAYTLMPDYHILIEQEKKVGSKFLCRCFRFHLRKNQKKIVFRLNFSKQLSAVKYFSSLVCKWLFGSMMT